LWRTGSGYGKVLCRDPWHCARARRAPARRLPPRVQHGLYAGRL